MLDIIEFLIIYLHETKLTKPKEIGRYTIDMFESITRKFQFKFKDRVSAANILAAALMDSLNNKKKVAHINLKRFV
jgi:hypothetical protein